MNDSPKKKSRGRGNSKVAASARVKFDSPADDAGYACFMTMVLVVTWKSFQLGFPQGAEKVLEMSVKESIGGMETYMFPMSVLNAPLYMSVLFCVGLFLVVSVIPVLFGRGTHKVTYAVRRADGLVRIVERWFLLKWRIKQRKGRFVDRIAVGFHGDTHTIQLLGDKGYAFDVLATKNEASYREKLAELEKTTSLSVGRV